VNKKVVHPRVKQIIRVLLVEDNPGDALLLRELINEVQSPDTTIEWTESDRLADALLVLADADLFDVVLLDLSLPDSQGLATFEQVHLQVPLAPVVMLTGLNDETMAAAAMERGAQDYLVKGQVDGHALLRSMRYAIERTRRRVAEESVYNSKMEMRVAQAIQRKLFPQQAPEIPGFDIAGASFPADATGGDYFDYFPLGAEHWMIAVGDVSSHGFGPALLMAETRAYLRAFSRASELGNLNRILTWVNRAITEDTKSEQFVTLIAARLDITTRQLAHASCGHPPGFVLDANGQIRAELKSTGLPLGISEDNPLDPEVVISLVPGDLVMLSTDGIDEARNANGEEFGRQRLLETVQANRQQPAAAIIVAIRTAIRTFAGDAPQKDDITAVIIKVLA
jgi:sigma-B regulation protein RsbU (phosphoserine phosphatase)